MDAAMNGTVLTPLHQAIVDNDFVEVKSLLATGGIDVNAVGEYEKRPLHVAAEIGNLDIVRPLLAYKATDGNHLVRVDVNAADTMGSTPLHYAVEKGHEAVVRELLAGGEINPNATAEHNDSKTPLHIAAEKGRLGIVQALLKSGHIIHVNAGDRLGWTALHHAAVGESEEVVEELLSYCKLYGLDNAPKNKTRASPLHLAALFGRHKIVSKLVAVGLPVNETAFLRLTPLHFAVQSGSSETVRVLLQESEDLKVSEVDWKGLTPVKYARQAWMTNKNGFRPESLPPQKSPQEDAQRMMQMLQRVDMEGLRNDRQSSLDAANAILVGAALIASISFASWLQPPLGFQPTYSSQFLELSPATPLNTYRPFVYFHSNDMKAFWVFNSMSFFFAIASFLLGAAVGFPKRLGEQVEENHLMIVTVSGASICLVYAVVCIVGAFICAGFTDLPSIPQDWGCVLATAVAGGIPCMAAMIVYNLHINRLVLLEVIRVLLELMRASLFSKKGAF